MGIEIRGHAFEEDNFSLAAGFNGGLTSTDFIRVGNRTIDTGDYSGTGGARMLLRQPDVEMAVLEVARGGLLRRGLGVERANVGVVTNVAADHLGEYGINSVSELLPAKFIVSRALTADDTLVLNADDAGVVASDTFTTHYYAESVLPPDPQPALDLETFVAGADADAAPGPSLLEGTPVAWTYVVTNTGDVTLSGVAVDTDTLTQADGSAPSCS